MTFIEHIVLACVSLSLFAWLVDIVMTEVEGWS
jgi:hypothetical protein